MEDADSTTRPLISAQGRLVLSWTNTPKGGYYCANPADPSAWQDYNIHMRRTYQAVVLTPSEADSPVSALSVPDLDARIRELWGGVICIRPGYEQLYRDWLGYFIAQKHSFGVVHAWVGAFNSWMDVSDRNFASSDGHQEELVRRFTLPDPAAADACEAIDGVACAPLREPGEAITTLPDGTRVIPESTPHAPRRIWDVCANRVIPSSWYKDYLHSFGIPISHAWVAGAELTSVVTPINLKLWPVPLPRGVRLEDIRRTLIAIDMRYVWLDVLCLRQVAAPAGAEHLLGDVSPETIRAREARRLEEWETDVPLIGHVYKRAYTVLVYLNGLGRPFRPEGWESERHWLRRAWTLQETKPIPNMLVLGGEGGAAIDPWDCEIDTAGTTLRAAIHRINEGALDHFLNLDLTLQDMTQRRFSSNPVDQVCGLLHPFLGFGHAVDQLVHNLHTNYVPVYHPSEPPSRAWARLVQAIAVLHHSMSANPVTVGQMRLFKPFATQLLQLFPHPSARHWFPSWEQVRRYPDVSVREEQTPLADVVGSDKGRPLRLPGHRVYRNIRLRSVSAASDGTGTGTASYIATGMGPGAAGTAALPQKATLHPTHPTHPPHPDLATGNCNPDEPFVLVDITPYQKTHMQAIEYLGLSCMPGIFPMWDTHVVLVCREATEWREPRVVEGDGEGARGGGQEQEQYEYLLRRVTTLLWTPGEGEGEGQGEGEWLPFGNCPVLWREVLEREGGGKSWFARSSVDVMLQ